MHSQSHLDYCSFFNNYYQDPRPLYTTYSNTFDSNFAEDQENQDFTFLPKTTTFFDTFDPNLEASRQSTDITDAANSPLNFKGHSPNSVTLHKYNIPQGYNSNFGTVNAKALGEAPKSKFNSMLGGNTGIPYNTPSDAKPLPDQTFQITLPSRILVENVVKMEEKENEVENQEVEGIKDEEEDSQNQDLVLSAQLKSLIETNIWNEERDHLLLKLASQYKCDWKKIAKRFNHKKLTPHFLKIRYKELTCAPLQRRVKFTHKEDLMIAKYFEKLGSNWAQMATHFKDRSAIMLKNRYYSFIRKRDLLDDLMKEVREIEKDNQDVDRIQDQESETYVDFLKIKKEVSFNDDSEPKVEEFHYEVESSFKTELPERINPVVQFENRDKHPIFGFEGTCGTSPETELTESLSSMKEVHDVHRNKVIDTLRAKVKSLQSLYVKTRAELDKLKGKNHS